MIVFLIEMFNTGSSIRCHYHISQGSWRNSVCVWQHIWILSLGKCFLC